MTISGTLQSLQVGTPREYDTRHPSGLGERVWSTSFIRVPSPESRWLFTTHLEGNTQADTLNHGRPDQAVLMYAAEHYPLWRAELNRNDIGPGGFGENFTVAGLNELTVCIGDIYAVGDALIQITGPRYPCWKIERRWGIDGLTDRVASTGRTGWYYRVLREGLVAPSMTIDLCDRPCPDISVALVNDVGHFRNADPVTARAVAACPLLHEWWQRLALHCVEKMMRSSRGAEHSVRDR